MCKPKYKVNEKIEGTVTYGDVTVTDIFQSVNFSYVFVYQVLDGDGATYLATETELDERVTN